MNRCSRCVVQTSIVKKSAGDDQLSVLPQKLLPSVLSTSLGRRPFQNVSDGACERVCRGRQTPDPAYINKMGFSGITPGEIVSITEEWRD